MMTTKIVWFAAGTAAGLYASVKARRAAYRLSMPGLIDQTEAVVAGARQFGQEMREGMAAKEHQFRLAALAGPEPGPQLDTITSRPLPLRRTSTDADR